MHKVFDARIVSFAGFCHLRQHAQAGAHRAGFLFQAMLLCHGAGMLLFERQPVLLGFVDTLQQRIARRLHRFPFRLRLGIFGVKRCVRPALLLFLLCNALHALRERCRHGIKA